MGLQLCPRPLASVLFLPVPTRGGRQSGSPGGTAEISVERFTTVRLLLLQSQTSGPASS